MRLKPLTRAPWPPARSGELLTGGLRFVDDRPWAHLDIAGTAWAEERKPYQPKGATGVAARLLIELGLTGI